MKCAGLTAVGYQPVLARPKTVGETPKGQIGNRPYGPCPNCRR